MPRTYAISRPIGAVALALAGSGITGCCLTGCCLTPSPPIAISAPPASTVVPGGGPQLPSLVPGVAVDVSAGFADPMLFRGVAGGPRDASSSFGSDCRGMIGLEPSQRIRLLTSFPYLRVMARGDSDLTLVVRSAGGASRCNDDSDGLNPVVDGAFEPGVYDVYVGRYSAGPPVPYDLGLSTSAALNPTTMISSAGTPVLGSAMRSGLLRVATATTAPISVGDTCTYSEVSVPPTTEGLDVRWTITCGFQVLYGADNTGYGRSSNASWPPGTIAFDEETTEVDTDPAFEWTATLIRLRDDATGPIGAYEIVFEQPGAP